MAGKKPYQLREYEFIKSVSRSCPQMTRDKCILLLYYYFGNKSFEKKYVFKNVQNILYKFLKITIMF